MGMKRGLGVDLLEELLAGHRRREHAEGPLRGASVALGGRRRAAVGEGDRVEACVSRKRHTRAGGDEAMRRRLGADGVEVMRAIIVVSGAASLPFS